MLNTAIILIPNSIISIIPVALTLYSLRRA